jgi:hypothetical protein
LSRCAFDFLRPAPCTTCCAKKRFSRDRAITLDAAKAYAKRCIDALVGVDAESRRRDEKARGLRVLFVAKSAEYTKGLFFFYPLRHGLPS